MSSTPATETRIQAQNKPPAQAPGRSPPAVSDPHSSELFIAVTGNDPAAVKAALNAGASPSTATKFEVIVDGVRKDRAVAPLEALLTMSRFALAQKLEVLRLFKEKGADFNIHNAQGFTLLSFPIAEGAESEALPLVHALLEYGADPSIPNGVKLLEEVKSADGTTTNREMTFLEYPPATVLKRPDFSPTTKVALLAELARAKANFNSIGTDGRPPWQLVVATQRREDWYPLIEALLQGGMDPNIPSSIHYSDSVTSNGQTTTSEGTLRIPLLHSILGGSSIQQLGTLSPGEITSFVQLLRRYKADFNLPDSRGMTPLQVAILYHKVKPAELEDLYTQLTALGADITRSHSRPGSLFDLFGGSGLNDLFRTRDLPHYRDLVIAALGRMDDVNAGVMSSGHGTALHFMVQYGEMDVVRWLLDHGADVNARNDRGETPLMTLRDLAWPVYDAQKDKESIGKALEIIRLFVARHADLQVADKSGVTTVGSLADYNGWADLVKALVAAGADFRKADQEDLTPLWKAVTGRAKTTEAFLRSRGASEMHSHPVPVGNQSVIARAILDGKLDVLLTLPKEDFTAKSIRLLSGIPATPLHLAVEQGTVHLVQGLIGMGFDWNTPDQYGRTPLTLAVLAGRADVVNLLLEARADPNLVDGRGESPYSHAVSRHPELLPLFWKKKVAPGDAAYLTKAIYTDNLDAVKGLGNSPAPAYDSVVSAANLGRPEITAYLLQKAPAGEKSPQTLREEAQKTARVLSLYPLGKPTIQPVAGAKDGLNKKKGNFSYVLKAWSPWLATQTSPPPPLKDYPVYISIPDNYDDAQPWGLLVSMLSPLSKNQYASGGYLESIKKHHLIWVGFDPYFGNSGIDPVFNGSTMESMAVSHESFILAIVHDLLSHFSVDRKRVYLAGFSWGGRLTGEIVPRYPELFTGGIAAGGCFTTKGSALFSEAMDYARRRVTMVLSTGDYDYNRLETWNGYNLFLEMGYRAEYYQDPIKDHAGMSAPNFESALSFLDEGSRSLK